MAFKYSRDGLIDIKIDLDLSNCLFKTDDLDCYEEEYLENKGYFYGEFVPIGSESKKGFHVKKNTRESLSHTFLVHNIKEEIQKYTKEVNVFITTKPDILFKNKKGNCVALEIESGKNFKRHKERIKNKFANCLKKYPETYIVLTSTKMKNKYKRLFPNIRVMVRTDIRGFLKQQFKKR